MSDKNKVDLNQVSGGKEYTPESTGNQLNKPANPFENKFENKKVNTNV